MRAANSSGVTQTSFAAQMWLTHGIVGALAAAIALGLTRLGMRPLTALGGAAVAASLAGLLLTFNVQRGLGAIEAALTTLAHGRDAELAGATRLAWWPLTSLAAATRAVGVRMQGMTRRERRALDERAVALQQAGVSGAQEERNRLARELHDSIKQQIFAISVSAAAANARWESDPPGARAALDDIRQSAQEATVELQALLQELRPATLERVGMVEALRIQCQALAYRTGAQVELKLGDLPADEQLPPRATETVFRIAQEALANAARHARASHITLSLQWIDDALVVEVADDGQGFSPESAPRGIGLASMRERADALGGTLTVRSAPNAGTTIQLRAPLAPPIELAAPEPVDPAVDRAVARARRAQNLGFNLVSVTWLLIFAGLPAYFSALGLAVAVFCVAQARQRARQVATLTGNASLPTLALGYFDHALWQWLALFAALVVWYLPATQPAWAAGAPLALTTMVSALLLLASLAQQRWAYRARQRHWVALAPDDLRAETDQSRRMLLAFGTLWLLLVVLAVTLGQYHPGFLPRSAAQWTDDASLIVLVALAVDLAVDAAQMLRWRGRLTHIVESAPPTEKGAA